MCGKICTSVLHATKKTHPMGQPMAKCPMWDGTMERTFPVPWDGITIKVLFGSSDGTILES